MRGGTPKVMVAGHICLDITPVFPPGERANLAEVLAPGKLVNVGAADFHAGGAVSNTGLAMKLFGADVRLAGKIGHDQFGRIIRRIAEKYGCEGGLIEDSKSASSYTLILAIPGIDRIFLHHPGANGTFCAGDITDAMLEGVEHLHIGYPPLLRRMYREGGRELLELFRRVKDRGITTSLDLAAVDPDSEAAAVDWRGLLGKVLPLVDFFVPSAEELCAMLDPARYRQWAHRAGGGDMTQVLSVPEDVQPLGEMVLEMGAKVALIKCGAPGMYYRTAAAARLQELCALRGLEPAQWARLEGFERSYRQDHVVSGTGAGDTSIAAFLTAMLRGADLARCVRLAAATGACCIAARDALSGLVPLEILEERIAQGWEKATG